MIQLYIYIYIRLILTRILVDRYENCSDWIYSHIVSSCVVCFFFQSSSNRNTSREFCFFAIWQSCCLTERSLPLVVSSGILKILRIMFFLFKKIYTKRIYKNKLFNLNKKEFYHEQIEPK